MSREGKFRTTYTKSGSQRFSIEIWHDELDKYQMIKGTNELEVKKRAKER